MTKPPTHRTATGREVTDEEIASMAADLEVMEFDIDALKARRRGRPMIGTAPAEVVPVRIDPALKAAIDARAAADDVSISEVIRNALKKYLHVA